MILDFYNFSRPRAAAFLTPLDKNEEFCYTYDIPNRVTANPIYILLQ